MTNGDNITINHKVHGEMRGIVIAVNATTVKVLTLAGPITVKKEDVK